MNHNKRRTFPLKLIQISFIKGCSKLQQAVWRFCSKEPQMALSNKISYLILSQAIKYLINAREKLRKQALKDMIQKWSKNAQLMSISNLNKINILKNRINRIDSYKRFILSKAMKNWKIKKEKIVKNLLKGMAVIKLYESFSKKKCKFSFRSRINNIMITKNSRKPTRGFPNLYEKSKNRMKRRALKYWRSRVQDINNQNKKRQLVLKKIVKSLIGKNNAGKKNALYKWRYSTLEIRNENKIFMLRRGLLTISLYSKWHKTNLLNALSITSNEWRSKKGSNNYKEKIFQAKPHLFRHNINMKGKKVINNLTEKYNFKSRGVKFKSLDIIADKNNNLLLQKTLEKWKRIAKHLSKLNNRRDAILRGRVNKNELYKNMVLAHKFNIWRVSAFKENDLIKAGAMLRFLNLLKKKALNPIKVDFMNELYNHRDANYYKKALSRMIYFNKRCRNLMKRKYLNKWKGKASLAKSNNFQKNLLLKDIIRKKQSNINNILRKLINKWNKISNNIKNNIDKTLFYKGITIFALYNKWFKIQKMNTLASYFNEWRRKILIKPFYFEKLLIDINRHLLKFNILKNGNDLLNSLRAQQYIANRQNKLQIAVEKGDKIKYSILKKTLRKWYKKSLKVYKNNYILEKLLINNDFRMNILMKKIVRKCLYTWLKNAKKSKIELSNTKNACSLLRKAATEAFFAKVRKEIQKKIVEDRFKSIMVLILRKRDKNYLRNYINLWRTTTRKLRAYNMIGIFFSNYWSNREKLYKFRIILYLKEKASLMNTKLDNSRMALSSLVYRLDALNRAYDKEILGRYLNKWKTNSCLMKNTFQVISSYIEGIQVLKKFYIKTAHPDLLNALDNILREKPLINIKNKWKYISHRLLHHQINILFKIVKINKILNKITKRKFLEKFKDLASFSYLNDLLNYLLSKYDCITKKYILRKRFKVWAEQINRLKDYEDSMASRIQNAYKNHNDTQKKLHKIQLQILLKKFIGRIINKSELSLQSAFYRWSKNTRILRCSYHSTLIQDFCYNIKDVLKSLVWKKRLKKFEKGLEVLDSANLGLRYAYDKLVENNRNFILCGVTYLLQEKVNNRRRNALDKINEYHKIFVLNKLFFFRKKYIDNILCKMLYQWKENSFEIRKRVKLEEDRNIRINTLLKMIFDKYDNDKMDIFKRNLHKWRDKAKEKKIEIYSRIIAKSFKNKYKLSKARINWSNLVRHLRNYKCTNETKEIIGNIKKLIGLQSFINDLTGKFKFDGLNQLKQGYSWIAVIEILKNILIEKDEMNKLEILKRFLNRWKNIVDRLADRDNKLEYAFKNIFKRLLIDKAKDMNNIFISKKIENILLASHSHFFFKKLKNLSEKKEKLIKNQRYKIRKIFRRIKEKYKLFLRRKLVQWKNKTKKIIKDASQKRIVDFIKNKYKISIYSDYWKKLAKRLNTFYIYKDLYCLLQKLKKIMTLKSIIGIIDKAFKKSTLSQLKEGVNYLRIINSLKRIFIDLDNRNAIVSLHQIIKRWKDNANRLKDRDNKISKAFNILNRVALKNDTSSLGDAFIVKKFEDTLPICRAIGFFENLINKASRFRAINDYKCQKIKKLVNRLIRDNTQVLRNKFFKWLDISKRVKSQACQRKIAKLIENKYKARKARSKWNDLVEKYDLFVWGIIHFCFILKKIYFPNNLKNKKNNSFKIMKKIKADDRDLKLLNILEKYNNKKKIKYTFRYCNFKMMPTFENLFEGLRNVLPEMPNGEKYNFKCDLSNIEVIIYILYFNIYPHMAMTMNEIIVINKIKELVQKIFKSNKNKKLDNLIKGLLASIPNKRINLEKNINYPLIKKKSLSKQKHLIIDLKINTNNYKDYYENIEEIGKGSYSLVYKAKVKGKEEYVALKIFDKEKIKEALRNEYCKQDIDEEYYKKINFGKEIKFMKICGENNENSVKYYQKYETDNKFVIVMELCDGNLIDFIKLKRDINISDIYEILCQLNHTFKIMNKNKIAHRDLKLQNILFKYGNKDKTKYIFKISDYGVGKEFLSCSCRFSTKVGTLNYMAPEVLKGEKYNNECDLWSLGMIIYMLCFKKLPYKGDTETAIINQVKHIGKKAFRSSGNTNFDDLIQGLLTSIPNERLTWEEYFNHPFFKNKLFT